ncbi:hypothetical protein ACWGHU_24400 [Streptomyces xanthophaeus]
MAAKKDQAELAPQSIEEFNRVVLDDAKDLLAPTLSEATQAQMSLVDRLPQAYEQIADGPGAAGRRRPGHCGAGRPEEVATTAAVLRAVVGDSE